MALNPAQKKYLRGLGHGLKPVIIVGESGLSDTLMAEFERTLSHHELMKVSIRVGNRGARDELIGKLCGSTAAELVQRIGNVALLYRRNPDAPKIDVPSVAS